MGVWSFEAADIANSDDLESRPIYRTPAIETFLRSEKSAKRIISGLKGTGKTLFLKVISHHYRQLAGVTLIPKHQLTERLYSIDYDFSADKAQSWASNERWEYVWRTVLSVIILKAVRQEIPPEVLTIFPESLGLSVGAHVSAAMRSRAVNDQSFPKLFPKVLDSRIQGITQPVALFLDNIDEALARHANYELYRDSVDPQRQLGTHSYGLWLAAQIGFVLALRELTARNEHLKLFGTVRAEAIHDNRTPTGFNVQAIVLDLRYTPEDLRGIFETKLRHLFKTSPQSFSRPSEGNPIKAFFQQDRIEHPSVKRGGYAYAEEIFDYIRRHTRGRPRELDFIGYGLEMIRPDLRTSERIREKVRELSQEFFGFAKNEAVPFWEPKLDRLLDNIPSNFISRRKAERIAERLFGAETGRYLWNALYANGLCGAVVRAHPTGAIQRFVNHGVTFEQSDFRSARTWVLHPCVNIATWSRRTRYRPNSRNVAGHAYLFAHEPRLQKRHLHVLIGAGRLGLGLVVPMLLKDKGTNVLIVTRAAKRWEAIRSGADPGKYALHIKYFSSPGTKRNVDTISLSVVTDEREGWADVLRTSFRRSRCVLFISSNNDSLQSAICLGDSIGTAVGPGLEAVTKVIGSTKCKARLVVGYENDEELMRKASKALQSNNMVLVPTVVDRICIEREVGEEAVVIRAEPYGRITAFTESATLGLLPPAFSSEAHEEVQTTSDADNFNFVREKKKRLVNSLHAAAAALVQRELVQAGARSETADDVVLGIIARNMDISTQLVGVKELMILAILGRLLQGQRAPADVANLIRELNEYGDNALRRMLEGPDAPSRVLRSDSQSLAKKYNRLFADVKDLALIALRDKDVQAVLPMSETEITVRLSVLNEAFLSLFSRAGLKAASG